MTGRKLMGRLVALCLPAGVGIVLLGTVAATSEEPEMLLPKANGDVNGSMAIDISDGIYLLNHLFLGGPEVMPLACEPNAVLHNGDVNGDGAIDVSDPIYLLRWLFVGGPEPKPGCLLPSEE